MNTWKYHSITSSNLNFLNPSSLEKLDEMVGLLDLPEGARVLDLGCGKGEALIRIAEQHHISGTGVDLSPDFIRDARTQAEERVAPPSKLEFMQMKGQDFTADQPFDLTICLGASWVFGGLKGTLSTLKGFTGPKGLVVVGEPYCVKEPSPEYLKAMQEAGTEPEAEHNYSEIIQIAVGEGLIPLYSLVSTQADWDRYEWNRIRALELYALNNPDDPDNEAMIRRIRTTRDLHVRFAREHVGWALYLFARP